MQEKSTHSQQQPKKQQQQHNPHHNQQQHYHNQQQQQQRRRGAKGRNQSSFSSSSFSNTEDKKIPMEPNSTNLPNTQNNTTPLVFRPHKTLLIHLTENTPTWYECGRNTPGRDDTVFSIATSHSSNNSNNSSTTKNNTLVHSKPKQNPPSIIVKYRTLATQIYHQEIVLAREKKQSPTHHSSSESRTASFLHLSSSSSSSTTTDKDTAWLENAIHKGTLKDRIAAMSVLIHTNPVHQLHVLDMLLHLAGVSTPSDRVSTMKHNTTSTTTTMTTTKTPSSSGSPFNVRIHQMAAEALVDLFIHTLLPKHRKLYSLDARPLFLYEATEEEGKDKKMMMKKKKEEDPIMENPNNNNNTQRTLSSRVLLLWRYEEMLKQKYTSFLMHYLARSLSQNSASALELHKVTVLRTAANLLAEIPEGESIVLTMIVNKLGDPSRKIAAAAGHQLRLILEIHPQMTPIIAREVQQLAYRPHLSSLALYNCIIFLNQLKLTSTSYDTNTTNKKNTGTTSQSTNLPASLIKTYFQLFEVTIKKSQSSFTTGKTLDSPTTSSPRTDIALKGRLLSALLTGVNRARPYLPEKDLGMDEHVEALYRIAHISPPAACTQALMLLFNVTIGSSTATSNSSNRMMTTRTTAAKHGSTKGGKWKKRLEPSKDMAASTTVSKDDSSKSMNVSSNPTSSTKIDRFYRIVYEKIGDPNMLSGRQVTLFFNLVYKTMKNDLDPIRLVAFAKRLLHTTLHFYPSVVSGTLFLLSEVMKYRPSLYDSITTCHSETVFDPTKREPKGAFYLFNSTALEKSSEEKLIDSNHLDQKDDITASNKENLTATSLWEVSLGFFHYHPTVSKFTSLISNIVYDGDPLRDITLARFLDKFAFRNPKSVDKIAKQLKRGESVGEKRSGVEGKLSFLSSLPVNDPEFWSQAANHVSESDEFYQKFFIERARRDEIKGINRRKTKDDDNNDDDALDIAEGKEVDFDDEDTDPEEEAFVEKLAQKLMTGSGVGKAHYDDEDPDMDGWNDLGDDDSDSSVERLHEEDDNHVGNDGDEFCADVDDANGEDYVADSDDLVSLNDMIEGASDSDESEFGDIHNENNEYDEALIFGDRISSSLLSKRKVNNAVFAAAEDYDDIIAKAPAKRKPKAPAKRKRPSDVEITNKDSVVLHKKKSKLDVRSAKKKQ